MKRKTQMHPMHDSTSGSRTPSLLLPWIRHGHPSASHFTQGELMKTGPLVRGEYVVRLALALGVFSAPVRAQTADSAAVARLVESYHVAEKAGDSTAMLALLSDDAVVLEAGGIETKADFRAHHIAADIAFIRGVRIERSAVRVRVRGDAAWASSTSTTQGESNGRTINSAGAELMVLAKESAGWKITAIHWSSRQRGPR